MTDRQPRTREQAMSDGRELELRPGDAHLVGPGHDAWVVGDEPCVTVDFIPAGDTVGGRAGRCPCGVEFRIATDHQLDHLVAAIQEHAKGSHDHELTREHVLAEVGVISATPTGPQPETVWYGGDTTPPSTTAPTSSTAAWRSTAATRSRIGIPRDQRPQSARTDGPCLPGWRRRQWTAT